MNCLQNFAELGKALLHDEGSDVDLWLKKEISKWEELAGTLFDVHCYLKSKQKRNSIEYDNMMYALWLAWQKAFPGKSFNTFHGMFCSICNFVHKYKMTRRVSEEMNKLFNCVLASVKRLLAAMPATVG